jgi:transcriptional antiterminator RfaH
MNLWRELNWYAVYSRPGREDQAAMNIGCLRLDLLLPKREAEKLVWGVPHQVLRPLFPRYLFVRFCPATHLHLIRYARGVSRIVSAGDVPLPVDAEIIRAIRSRICEQGFVKLGPQTLHPGERVIIQEGACRGLSGIFERELKDRERVILLLEAIEYQARVVIEKRYLKAAEAV